MPELYASFENRWAWTGGYSSEGVLDSLGTATDTTCAVSGLWYYEQTKSFHLFINGNIMSDKKLKIKGNLRMRYRPRNRFFILLPYCYLLQSSPLMYKNWSIMDDWKNLPSRHNVWPLFTNAGRPNNYKRFRLNFTTHNILYSITCWRTNSILAYSMPVKLNSSPSSNQETCWNEIDEADK